MNTILRRILLGILAATAAFVGIWAAALPSLFYSSFPGLGLHWIADDGPFNEHLIRDVGGLYVGFAVAAIAAIVSRTTAAGRVIGIGWVAFGILHVSYHVGHPEGSAGSQVGTVVSLAIDLLLGILLALPGRNKRRVLTREASR